ncbi:MAG: hypothetical protein ACRDPT_16835, partial [Streptomycetales bacterium]
MKLYADRPAVWFRQLTLDLGVLAWTLVWVRLAETLHGRVMDLAEPGRRLEDAGTGLAGSLSEAGAKAGGVPLVGDALSAPLDKAGAAGAMLAEAGRNQQEAVGDLALVLAALVLVLPLGLVAFGWLPRRVRWIVRATAARRCLRTDGGLDVLALRALA